jgi:hypothetical protein
MGFSAEPYAFCAWRASLYTPCAIRLAIALAQQSSHCTPMEAWLKTVLAIQMQPCPLVIPPGLCCRLPLEKTGLRMPTSLRLFFPQAEAA